MLQDRRRYMKEVYLTSTGVAAGILERLFDGTTTLESLKTSVDENHVADEKEHGEDLYTIEEEED